MHVHVILRVHVIEEQPSFRERFELRTDLELQLSARSRIEEIVNACTKQIGFKLTVTIDEIRNVARRQRRRAIDQHDV